MRSYLDLVNKILQEGHQHPDRTGVGRISIYGETLRFKMADGFPIVTTRHIPFKTLVKELLWFISGSSDTRVLHKQNVHIWDQWAVSQEHIDAFMEKYKDIFQGDAIYAKPGLEEMLTGSIGPLYGPAWRNAPTAKTNPLLPPVKEEDVASDKLKHTRELFKEMVHDESIPEECHQEAWSDFLSQFARSHIDQLQNLITGLKKDPYGSRHVVSAWIPDWLPVPGNTPQENVLMISGALAPCHAFFQCHVMPPKCDEKPKLILELYQRSADVLVGVPFNIAQYSVLLHLLAKVCDYEPYEFIHHLGDCHVYSDQVETYTSTHQAREPMPLPVLELDPSITDIYEVTADQIELKGYQYHPIIKYPVAT